MLKKLWTRKLPMSLLMISTSGIPQGETVVEKTIAIEKGVPASFSGVLIPDWQWRSLNQDLQERDILKERLAEIPENQEPNTLQNLLIGFLAGSLTVLVVEKVVEK
jgi:hypothetical protein